MVQAADRIHLVEARVFERDRRRGALHDRVVGPLPIPQAMAPISTGPAAMSRPCSSAPFGPTSRSASRSGVREFEDRPPRERHLVQVARQLRRELQGGGIEARSFPAMRRRCPVGGRAPNRTARPELRRFSASTAPWEVIGSEYGNAATSLEEGLRPLLETEERPDQQPAVLAAAEVVVDERAGRRRRRATRRCARPSQEPAPHVVDALAAEPARVRAAEPLLGGFAIATSGRWRPIARRSSILPSPVRR